MSFLDRFKEVWLVDTEFYPKGGGGGLPVPVCLVAKEFRSGHEIRLWQDELATLKRCPYDTGPESLTVAYYASAEMGTFLALGWSLPKWVLDLYCEFRSLTNGFYMAKGQSLLGALSWYGVSCVSAVEKEANRDLILMGAGKYSPQERVKILNYCAEDTRYLEQLLPKMRDKLNELALLRGRYMKAAAIMERNGVPVDVPLLGRIQEHWEELKLALVQEVDKNYRVFEGTTFKRDRFIDWLEKSGYSWPMLAPGQPALGEDTFKDQCRIHPEFEPLRQLRFTLSKLRTLNLSVGLDERNRVLLSAFGAKTGRNAPSTTKFVFGPATWVRSLIKPEEGKALAYVDWSSAEFGIAAALSGDPCMKEAYQSGDPYLAFARLAGAVPPEATKKSHGHIRDLFKTVALGIQYGMGAKGLAVRLNIPQYEAMDLLGKHKRLFQSFWRWIEHVKDRATLEKQMVTVFGFQYHLVGPKLNLRSVVNFPMQANCAEMLRLACCWAVENGIKVCCPVHDALLVEADQEEIQDVVAATQRIMEAASEKVLGGFRIRSDASVVKFPDRYMDKRGVEMWRLISEFIRGAKEGGSKTDTTLQSGGRIDTPVYSYPY